MIESSDELQPSRARSSPRYVDERSLSPLSYIDTDILYDLEAIEDLDDDFEEDERLREQKMIQNQLNWKERPSVLKFGIYLCVVVFAMSVYDPSCDVMYYKLACNSVAENETCDPVKTQILLSNFSLALKLTASITSLFTSPKMSALSDRYGRKMFLNLILSSFLISTIGKELIFSHSKKLPFVTLLLVEFISSLSGGIPCFIALCYCYVSDVAEPHERIRALGLATAASYIGASFAPMVASFISGYTSQSMEIASSKLSSRTEILKHELITLKLSAFVLCAVLIFSIAALPESRGKALREHSKNQHASDSPRRWSIFNFLSPLSVLTMPDSAVSNTSKAKSHKMAVWLLISMFVISSGLSPSFATLISQYGIFKFSWSTSEIANATLTLSSTRAFVLMILTPILINRVFSGFFGFKTLKSQLDMVDFSMITIGCVFDILGYLFLGLSRNTIEFLISFGVGSIGSIFAPTAISSIIKFFPESKTGEVFGAIYLLANSLQILLPILFVKTYQFSLKKDFAQACWFLMSLIFAISFCAALVCKRVLNLTSETEDHELDDSRSSTLSASSPLSPLASSPLHSPEIQDSYFSMEH